MPLTEKSSINLVLELCWRGNLLEITASFSSSLKTKGPTFGHVQDRLVSNARPIMELVNRLHTRLVLPLKDRGLFNVSTQACALSQHLQHLNILVTQFHQNLFCH